MRQSLEKTTALAVQLIAIPSVNPPGGEDVIAGFAASWLEEAGIACRQVPLEEGRSSVVARIPGARSGSVVLCAHLDTVNAEPDRWRTNPYEPIVDENRLWGLGAADMKSAAAVLMQTCSEISATGSRPAKDVVLVLTADEEWSYRGARSVAESGLIDDAELIVIAEPTTNDVHTGQKGELWIEAAFSGREAHGSVPESGANAILAASRFCCRLQEELARWPEIPGRGRTSLNVGRFHGGRQVNIVPSEATIQLDVRVASAEHYARAIELVRNVGMEESAAVGGTFASREMTYHPAIASAADHPWAGALVAVCETVTGRRQPRGLTPYSTDAVSFVPVLDVPILVCGPGSILQAHQPNEFIEIEQIVQSLEIYRRLVATELS